ncbi:peptidase [Gardnerella pickettii]|uniref:peptidase n=1 Tax=Gardnerella pickettii TaxID=2914924 RepID=UPI0039EF61AB
MMNKKAIAAFAAGATLLAGFAMATPVFAADAQAPKNDQNPAAPKNDQNPAAPKNDQNPAAPKKKDSESTEDKIHALKLADAKAEFAKQKAELGKKKTALTTAATDLNNATQAVQQAKNSVDDAKRDLAQNKDKKNVNSLKDALNKADADLKKAEKVQEKKSAAFKDAYKNFMELLTGDYAKAVNALTALDETAVNTDDTVAGVEEALADDESVKNALNIVPSATIQQGNTGATKQGQAGANGAAAGAKTTVVEKKKDGGKKLPGTGVGVTLTALAATMLAGMGAAVRKARH